MTENKVRAIVIHVSVKFNLFNLVEFRTSGFIFLRLYKRTSNEGCLKNGGFYKCFQSKNTQSDSLKNNNSCFAVNALIAFCK